MKKMKSLFVLIGVIFALALFSSCQKDKESDFTGLITHDTTYDHVTLKFAEGSSSANGDTVHVLPSMMVEVYLTGLPVLPTGIYYQYIWSLGDGSPALTVPAPQHQYAAGIYKLVVTVTNPQSGVIITRSKWINSSSTVYPDYPVILIGATSVSGGYDYELGFLAKTVYNFRKPPYRSDSIPFVTGTFCAWPTPPPAAPDYVYINNNLYIVKHIVSGTNIMQEFQFGQRDNWSYAPGSEYWIITGTDQGKYRLYTNGGKIYKTPQSFVYIPGNNGDSINAVFPPTIRDSIMLGNMYGEPDSIRIFVNWAKYANGSQPFFNYKKLGVWTNVALHLLPGTDWGFYDLAIKDFYADNNRIYFRFGPNLSAPTVYGVMNHSKFFYDNMLALQIASLKNSGKQYTVIPTKN